MIDVTFCTRRIREDCVSHSFKYKITDGAIPNEDFQWSFFYCLAQETILLKIHKIDEINMRTPGFIR